jgi:hypothetical protein
VSSAHASKATRPSFGHVTAFVTINVVEMRQHSANVMSWPSLVVLCIVVGCLHPVQADIVQNTSAFPAQTLDSNATTVNVTTSQDAVRSSDGLMTDGVVQQPAATSPEDWSSRLWSESIGTQR